ncbi:methyltransferase [Candidatus Falkowbacteria bacterium]|nr:methyltransferase [Candidatus Falkowbacteria bacterium]
MPKPNLNKLRQDLIIITKNLTLRSAWGLFSPEKIDAGTALLLDQLETKPTDVSLDLGCGYGVIGLTVAKLCPRGTVHLIDKDFVAIEYTKKNAALNHLNNCKIYLSNGFDQIPKDVKFDTVISNLPAKISQELMDIFLLDAFARLKPGGKFYVVTISGLKEYI